MSPDQTYFECECSPMIASCRLSHWPEENLVQLSQERAVIGRLERIEEMK